MRDREREKLMERMSARETVRERKREGDGRKHWKYWKKQYLTKWMGFVDLNPICITIYGLLNSSRISIDSRCRKFLMFADYGVKDAVDFLKCLEEFRECVESRMMKGVEEEIREAALKLEYVLDSHVSGQFLSQSESERCPLLYSVNVGGMEQDIDGFVEKMMEMERVLNPWLKEVEREGDGEKESGMCELSDQSEVSVTRSWVMNWFATKAASVFSGMKEEYVKELGKLLPEDGEGRDYAYLFTSGFSRSGYAYLFTSGFSRSDPECRFSNIKDELMIWWMNKGASIFVKEEEEEEQLGNPLLEEEEDDDDDVSSRIGCAPVMSSMVGLTDLFCQLRNDLIEGRGYRVGTIVGMAGIGKTALAKKILQDPLISSMFEYRIIVRVGPKYQWEEIRQAILAQMLGVDKMLMVGQGDLDEYLREILKDKLYLIVLDNVWDRDHLCKLLGNIHRYYGGGGWVLVTTRKNQVAHSDGRTYQVSFLNKEESWDLLRGKMFGEKRCPHELEKAGKKIAENCEGLPLLILTVADLLSKAEKTPDHWSQVAANKTNSTFVNAYEQILEVVYPSYSDLAHHLKPCFLYLGAFPQNDEVRVSKLISLWSADGFLGVSYSLLQEYVDGFLEEIVSNNVALGTQWSYNLKNLKACSLHSVFWYLCKREAWNERFLLVLNSYKDAMIEGIESRRRLSIYKNVILSIKDARESIASMSVVHSLLCTGPYHQYQVPIFFGLRLLKVLDALTIRFYEFPLDVLKLVQLRYLALTCNENLPPSISKLWSLQSLILHQHLSIKSSMSQTYLPVEIWDLQELEYLQIMGKNLPDPPPGVFLGNLLTLLDVGAQTCTDRVLRSIPNLKKLRVHIELMPVASESLRFFDDISYRRRLESLQFVVVNPDLMFEIVAPPALVSFPNLTKLTLSGCGYPWEDMNEIAQLEYLKVLKLKHYAFRGEEWEVKEGEFQRLSYLLIEDTDLVKWTGVLNLQYLTIKNCYKLQEIPKLSYASKIWLVDCNPEICAKKMESNYCYFNVDSSWLDDV